MKTDVLLFVIDMQNDFCFPGGALYVNGAEKDAERLGGFISANSEVIDHIIMTQDNHNVIDISHPVYWEDKDGNHPLPFTRISTGDVNEGLWRPRFEQEKAVAYIRSLDEQAEFPHVIWPEHCIIGSRGAAIADDVLEPVRDWARKGRIFDLVIKGTNPLTEHFGALRANIPLENAPETQLNTRLVKRLGEFKTILVAGEAKSHCVATTVKQMLNIGGLSRRLVIIEDCMSDVKGFETLALPIYENAKRKGASFVKSTEWSI
jgi:nicotinamidase/pyrazinamidase